MTNIRVTRSIKHQHFIPFCQSRIIKYALRTDRHTFHRTSIFHDFLSIQNYQIRVTDKQTHSIEHQYFTISYQSKITKFALHITRVPQNINLS